MEFRTLEQARRFFQVQTPAQAGLAGQVEQAWRLKAQGRSRTQIAEELGVSLSTVKRYLRRQGGHDSFF
jgi:DNA-binding NarL/FixJ family response regulator